MDKCVRRVRIEYPGDAKLLAGRETDAEAPSNGAPHLGMRNSARMLASLDPDRRLFSASLILLCHKSSFALALPQQGH